MYTKKLTATLMCGALIILSGCASVAEVSNEAAETKMDAKTETTEMAASLYSRLGELEGITAVINEFADRIHHDERILQFWQGMGDDTRLGFKQKNINLVCAVTGGPCEIISRDAKTTHEGLGITEADFNVVAGHLVDVLNEFKVPQQEQDELIAIILTLHDDIVDRKGDNRLSKHAPVER